MPALMTLSVALAGVTAARGSAEGVAGALQWAAAASVAAALVSTLVVDVPINLATARWEPAAPPMDWQATRHSWEVVQGVRSWLFLLAFVPTCAAFASEVLIVRHYSDVADFVTDNRRIPMYKSQRAGETRHDLVDKNSMLAIAAVTTLLAGLHLADHAARGGNVVEHGLHPRWNHSGWPFTDDITPYTFSLFAVGLILLGGIAFTVRDLAGARYWLTSAVLLGALVAQVHLIPGPYQESFTVIYRSWVDNPAMGVLTVLNTVAVMIALLAMAMNAVRILRRTRSTSRD